MAAISGIEAAPPSAPAREQRQVRVPADFGGAISHRELVQEKLCVDPAALAEKKRAARALRGDDPPRESIRAQRFADDDAAYEANRDGRMGQSVDIKV